MKRTMRTVAVLGFTLLFVMAVAGGALAAAGKALGQADRGEPPHGGGGDRIRQQVRVRSEEAERFRLQLEERLMAGLAALDEEQEALDEEQALDEEEEAAGEEQEAAEGEQEGTAGEGTTEEGTGEEGTAEEGADEGTTEEGAEDEGTPDEAAAETPAGLAARIASLEARLAEKPGDRGLLWKLAVAYRAAGDYDRAIATLDELGALSPNGAKVTVMLALCLRAKGDVEGALTRLEGFQATVPGAVYAYRAILKEELGLLDEAVEDMEEAVALEPTETAMYDRLGEMYEESGQGEGVKVFVKGRKVTFDVPPAIIGDRTMVPVRAVAEALGAEVAWDGTTRTVTVVKGGTVVLIPVGSPTAEVNGTPVTLDVPAVIVGNRALIPLRFVSESLGAVVDWFGTGQVVAVN